MALIPQSDEEYLKQKGFDYEIRSADSEVHIILKNWPFPEAYIPRTAKILIRLLPGYPMSPLDMFWTIPDVKLVTGGWPLNADYHMNFNGESWQRWSRHYEWRPGVDNLRTFTRAIAAELALGR